MSSSSAPRVLGALLCSMILVSCGDDPKPAPPITQDRYIPPELEQTEHPAVPFTEVEQEGRISWQHRTGAFAFDDGSPSRYLPECMGPGVVLFDANSDGLLDLFVPNGQELEPGAASRHPPLLALNRGDCRFEDVTAGSGLDAGLYGMGGTATDLDGDGHPELLVTTLGGPRLFRHTGAAGNPRFEDITEAAGLLTETWTDRNGHQGHDWAVSAAFFDADLDGDLDLFVVNYVRWCAENDVFESLDGKHKSYAIPRRYEGHTCRLFLSEGEGTSIRFREDTEAAGLLTTKAKGMGLALWDLNGDRILDPIVSNDSQPNFLYISIGPGRFREQGADANIAFDEDGRTRAGMGIAAEDYARDGAVGIPIGNFSNEPVSLYREEAKLLFRDVGQAAGVAASTHAPLTFGLAWIDADLNGLPDLVIANGHLEPEIQEVSATTTYAQTPQLLLQSARGRFQDASAAASPAFATPLVARGLAHGDLDGDGDEDLVFAENGGGVRIYRNDQALGHRTLGITLEGRGRNLAAIGTRIDLGFSDGSQRRLFCRHGGSYASQSAPLPIIGLGKDLKVTAAKVTWPDGKVTEVPADQLAAAHWTLSWPD